MRPDAPILLRRTPLFASLDDDALGRLARGARFRTYKKGQLLFYEGDPGDALFVIASGSVKVTVASESDEELVLVTMQPPEALGEISLIDGNARSATVEALEATEVLCVGRELFLEVVASDPGALDSLMEHLGATIRRLIDHASGLVFFDLHARVAKALLRLAEQAVQGDAGEIKLSLPLTQGDLAAMVGGSRPAVNRVLKSFDERGLVRLEGRSLVVRDLEALRETSLP